METMRKPWGYKRKSVTGWWVGWYETGKRKAKAFPTKSLAEHFRHIKYTL
jgi:beta-lactamase class D